MIYVVIGQSGAGKTTFVKKTFLSGELKIVDDIVPYTTNGNICAVGKYGIGRRTEGTDTLPYNSGAKIRELIKKLYAEGKNIVIEGDRINNRATFELLETFGAAVKLYLVSCTLETSIKRLRDSGSAITVKFIKATRTRSENNFAKYRDKFCGEIVAND